MYRAERLYKNEIGVCSLLSTEKIILDTFDKSQALGGLILIDQVTNRTCAGGTVRDVFIRPWRSFLAEF